MFFYISFASFYLLYLIGFVMHLNIEPLVWSIFLMHVIKLTIIKSNHYLGVLLLNTVLTVEAGQARSHHDLGWQQFTDCIIELVNDYAEPTAFSQSIIALFKFCNLENILK